MIEKIKVKHGVARKIMPFIALILLVLCLIAYVFGLV